MAVSYVALSEFCKAKGSFSHRLRKKVGWELSLEDFDQDTCPEEPGSLAKWGRVGRWDKGWRAEGE